MAQENQNSGDPAGKVTESVVGAVKKTSEEAKTKAFKIKNSQIVTALLGGVGAVFFVFGTERLVEQIPIISIPIVEVLVGLFLLSISGLLIKKLSGHGIE